MYCINCGVKLGDTEDFCPLCNTVVCHPDFVKSEKPSFYPKGKNPVVRSGRKAICGGIIILFFIPLLLSFFSDFYKDQNLDWFGFVAGALLTFYVMFALPLWFKKPNPVIFTPISFLVITLFLLYINLATNGNWFLSFAFPITISLCVITTTLITLIYYVKKGVLYILGGGFILFGGFIFLVEFLLNLTFDIALIGWSIYPLIVFVMLGLLLIYLGISVVAREILKRKFFF